MDFYTFLKPILIALNISDADFCCSLAGLAITSTILLLVVESFNSVYIMIGTCFCSTTGNSTFMQFPELTLTYLTKFSPYWYLFKPNSDVSTINTIHYINCSNEFLANYIHVFTENPPCLIVPEVPIEQVYIYNNYAADIYTQQFSGTKVRFTVNICDPYKTNLRHESIGPYNNRHMLTAEGLVKADLSHKRSVRQLLLRIILKKVLW